MRIPYLNFNSTTLKRMRGSENVTSSFGGINQKVVTTDGEFADMENMSCREFPAIVTRKNRGAYIRNNATVKGMVFNDGKLYELYNKVVSSVNKVFISSGTQERDVSTHVAYGGGIRKLIPFGEYLIVTDDNVGYKMAYATLNYRKIDVEVERGTYNDLFTVKRDSSDGYIVFEDPNGTTTSTIFESLEVGDIIHMYAYTQNHLTTESGVLHDSDCKITETDRHWNNGSYTPTKKFKINVLYYDVFEEDPMEEEQEFNEKCRVSKYCPSIQFSCGNRLWGYDNDENTICASKLGDAYNWHVFEGTAMDSYAVTVGESGQFTGGINFNGYPLFMKEGCIITVYGDKPANYSISVKKLEGAKYGKSMVIINQTLYYVADSGVYSYNGVSTTKISENIKETITDAVAVSFDKKYYLSCKLGGVQRILVYDTEKGLWDIEDNTEFKCACTGDNDSYYADGTGIRAIEGSANESVDWMLESTDIREGSLDMKYVSNLKFNLWLSSGSEATVYMRYDDDPTWYRCGTVKATKNTTYVIPIIPQRCNKYRWKIDGKGEGKLIAVSRRVEGGTNDGNIQK